MPGDRRAVSVALTPEGREVAEGFHRDISEELELLTDVLGWVLERAGPG